MAPNPPPPPPPPPPREMLIKGTSMGRRQDVGQPGTGAPRKWSSVQIDQPRQKERDFTHTGFKLPELVFPGSDERAKKKVFRFLQPPTSGPAEAPSSVCRVDQSPPSAADDSPLTGGSQLRQPGKLPKVAGTAGMTFLEELKLRSNMQQVSDQDTLPGSQWTPQPGWPLPNVKPNSRGLIPPAPPFRERTRDTEHKIGVPQTYDQFVGSQNVIGLNEENFDNFISQKELAMVMFYDPFNPNSLQPKEHFKKDCSPVWYYVLPVVSAAWLTNFVLVAWIYRGRETKNNMRIPRALAHKSPQTSARSKVLPPPISGQEKSRRIYAETPASVRTLLSRPQNISPGQSVTTLDTSRKESAGLSPGSPEAYHKKNGPETRKVKKMVHDHSCGDDAHVSDTSSNRSNIANRQGHGHRKQGMASVSESSQGERVYKKEHDSCRREAPIKLGKPALGYQKLHGEDSKPALGYQKLHGEDSKPSKADTLLISRKSNHSFGHMTDRSGDTKPPSLEASHRPTDKSRKKENSCDLDLNGDNVYMKARTLKEVHSGTQTRTDGEMPQVLSDKRKMADTDTQTRTAGEMPQVLSDKRNMAESEGVKGLIRNDNESRSLDVGTQKSEYFDVATQMSSTDIQRRPQRELQRQQPSVTLKTPDPAGTPNAPRFFDSTKSPLSPRVIANGKASGDAVFSAQYELTNTKCCECGGTGTGDHFGKQVGCQETLCPCHPHRNTLGRSMGGTGNVDVHKTEMYQKLSSPQHDAKGKDETYYKADPFVFEGESLMPPPPFGYHVRRDFSNPESSTNLCKIVQFDSGGNDLNSMGLLNTNDKFASRAVVSIDDSENSSSSSSSSLLWNALVSNKLLSRDAVSSGCEQFEERRLDTERKKRHKRLVIIGKVNCANRKRKAGKQDTKTQSEMTREYGNEIFDNGNEAKREQKHDSDRMVHVCPMVVKAAKRTPEIDDKYTEDASLHTNKVGTTPGSFKTLDDQTSKQYYNILEYGEKQARLLRRKKNARHRSALKINSINIKRVNPKRESVDVRKLAKRLTKTTESQSCLNMMLENNHNSPHRRRMLPSQTESFEPSYYMNLNSNAGVSDPSIEGVPGGKTQTEPALVENVHSTHQLGSACPDTEVHATGSEVDSNVSPSCTNDDDDDVIIVVLPGISGTMVNSSSSNDQLKLGMHGPEGESQQKIQAVSDSERNQKKSQEQAHSEKIVDFRGDNHLSRSTASLPPGDPHINGPHSRTKKKIKTSETTLIKQENCIPKKVSGAAASKEWRTFVHNKARQEKQKLHVSNGDAHKTSVGSIENHNKITVEAQRFLKIGKSSETCSEIFEAKMKIRSSYENYLEYTALKEAPRPRHVFRNAQGQGVRSAESDHRCSPHEIASSTSGKSDDGSHIKRLVSLPETMPSQGSPKKSSVSAHNQHKPNLVDNSCSIQVKSPPITRTSGFLSATPVCPKQESMAGASLKSDIVGKRDGGKRADSPNKDADAARGEVLVSPREELSNLKEKNVDTEQTPTTAKVSASDEADNAQTNPVCPETTWFVESPSCVQSIDAQMDNVSRTKRSPSLKSADIALRYRNKKNLAENGKGKNLEYATTKEDHGESSNGKLCAHLTLNGKKKNVTRFKTHSRSPDGKRKKRNPKRSSIEAEDIKTEKSGKLKGGDKLTEKKKKKKKSKQKPIDDKEERTQVTGVTEHLVYKSRSRSNERNKLSETVVLSMPSEKLDVTTSEPGLSLFLHTKRKQEGRSASSTGRLASSCQMIQSFNRQQLLKYDELKIKSHTSSVESTSSASGSNMPVMSAESLLPFPVSTPKASAKAVQLHTCAKVQRNEKDLQQAELGWNSTFSNDDKGIAEKAKQNQKRAMVRYYIVKPKPKKTEKEVGVSKLKRPAPRVNHPDEDVGGSGSELDLSCEVVPPERVKPGQGKSVQFSDNIEDLEASKEEAIIDRPLRRPDSDSILHHPIVKASIESIKAASKLVDPEIAATVKALPQKKEEQRSPVMVTRKRRQIWLKKSTKDKPATAVAKANEAVKSVALGVPVTKLHSSDNVLKGSSRFNLHAYCPMKATVGSHKLSNTSLTDKRKVTYKTWINSIFMAAPMNKATKKVVAKAGSPVDIKEIIEGSSVDAIDHFKISKPLHDGDVRPARSVPSLAPNKSSCVDLIIRKKHKFSDDSCLVYQKKSKDKPRECWSPRSLSTAESKEPQIVALKICLGVLERPTSPVASSNVDFVVAFKQKNGLSRIGDQGHRRRKEKKGDKKLLHESGAKWQAFTSHESRNVTSLEHGQYFGDVVDLRQPLETSDINNSAPNEGRKNKGAFKFVPYIEEVKKDNLSTHYESVLEENQTSDNITSIPIDSQESFHSCIETTSAEERMCEDTEPDYCADEFVLQFLAVTEERQPEEEMDVAEINMNPMRPTGEEKNREEQKLYIHQSKHGHKHKAQFVMNLPK